MGGRILVVEDEPAIADTIVYALSTEGFEAHWHATGQAALAALGAGAYDLAVLDVGLPDVNGFDLFREISARWSLPVIFLTARNAEIDRVLGLELGADDYLAKPFSPRELAARVRTVLRRVRKSAPAPAPAPAVEAAGPFRVDDERKCISYHGTGLELSRYEYRLLALLISRPGRVWSREELMERVWEHPEVRLDRTVDAHIKQLRAKLRAVAPGEEPIETHRGMGYSLRPAPRA